MENFIFHAILVIFLNLSNSPIEAAPQKTLSCRGDMSIYESVIRSNGSAIVKKVYGNSHNDIERAGVLLCKDYGADARTHGDRFCVLLGHDAHLDMLLPYAGKVERQDRFSTETASREVFEETAEIIRFSPTFLSSCPYLYAARKQLFIVRNDTFSASYIGQANRKAQKNPHLKGRYKEMDDCFAIPVVNLLRLAQQIQTGEAHAQHGSYNIESRNGHRLKINKAYMDMFAHRHDPKRLINTYIVLSAVFQYHF